jgi:Fe2+ transport system protein B
MCPKVNLRSRKEQDHLVKYNLFQPITQSDSSIGISNVNFHIPTIIEEVKLLPKKERKSIKQQILTLQTTLASFMMYPLTSMANSTNQTVPVTTLPNSAEGIPPEIMELLIGLLKVSVAVGVVLAAILLVGAGIGKMFRMKDVNDWITDIIKGLVTVLCATPLIFIIYYLATKLFSGSGWFVTPF